MPGQPAKEDNAIVGSDKHPRAASEEAAAAVAADGVNVSVVRLPQVHDPVAQGLITPAIGMYRQKGVCTYVGEGRNRRPAAYILDVARLYGRRLKLPVKSIAPDEAQAYFGWLSMFAGRDMPASSAQTRRKLGWEPKGPGLIADLERLQVSNR